MAMATRQAIKSIDGQIFLDQSIDLMVASAMRHAMDFVPKATTKIAMRGREGRKRDFLKRRRPSRLNSGKKWNGMGAAN